jgi:hypothetical protein
LANGEFADGLARLEKCTSDTASPEFIALANKTMAIARAQTGDWEKASKHADAVIAALPRWRDGYYLQACFAEQRGDWPRAHMYASVGLKFAEKPANIESASAAYGWRMFDIAAAAACKLGLNADALAYTRSALGTSPPEGERARLEENVRMLEAAVGI